MLLYDVEARNIIAQEHAELLRAQVEGRSGERRVRRWLSEHLILRLGQSGASKRFSLDANAVCCYDGTGASTLLRVASDGRLYQLRTDPKTGARVARYSLG